MSIILYFCFVVFTETVYIESSSSLSERLTRIDAIIAALENRILTNAVNTSDKEFYRLDDGQVKIETQYRSLESMAKAIEGYEVIRERILNKLNGRNFTLRGWQGLR